MKPGAMPAVSAIPASGTSVTERMDPDDLIDFPCVFEFKAFGDAGAAFPERIYQSVASVVEVSREAMRSRQSSGGRYQCVTVMVHLHNSSQLKAVYEVLRQVEGIRYLL